MIAPPSRTQVASPAAALARAASAPELRRATSDKQAGGKQAGGDHPYDPRQAVAASRRRPIAAGAAIHLDVRVFTAVGRRRCSNATGRRVQCP
jgi:hypothetical protein